MAEPARQHDEVEARKVGIAVPDHAGPPSRHGLECYGDVALPVGAGKEDDAGPHEARPPSVPWHLKVS